MVMPGDQRNEALQHVEFGHSLIPLQPHSKVPDLRLIGASSWSEYQRRCASAQEVLRWQDAGGPDMGWGLVCGRVSGGTYCGDCDHRAISAWVLQDVTRSVFRGACIVRSGSGKVHFWFRSPNRVLSGAWRLRAGEKAGDIRGDGQGTAGPSYMVIPPSLHPDTGDPYRVVAGSFAALPVVADGEAFLREITSAYLGENPGAAQPLPEHGSKRVLVLDGEQTRSVFAKVAGLKLKGIIRKTLLVPGNQMAGAPPWDRMTSPSQSEIDFAVCCELIRRGVDEETAEEIFAATLVGDACYRNTGRPHHGHSYLHTTYEKATQAVEAEKRAANQAKGANFEVLEADFLKIGREGGRYRLRLQSTSGPPFIGDFSLSSRDMLSEKTFQAACFEQTGFVPQMLAGQRGINFSNFARVVHLMVGEVRAAPEAQSEYGFLATVARQLIDRLPDVDPDLYAQSNRLGWRRGDTAWIRLDQLVRGLQAARHTGFKLTEIDRVLDLVGDWETRARGWPDHEVEQLIVLYQRRASLPGT